MLIFKLLYRLLPIGLVIGVSSDALAYSDFPSTQKGSKAQPALNFWESQKKKASFKRQGDLTAQAAPSEQPFANAQSAEELRQLLEVREIDGVVSPVRSTPSSSLGVPTGYGAQWGNAWIGGALSSARSFYPDADGSLGFGIGFGDVREAVGLEVFTGIFNLDGADDSIGGAAGSGGAVGFKLHRLLDERGYFSAGLGMANAIRWGTSNTYGGDYDTYFGVVTGRFDLQENVANPLPLIVSVGLGTGAFRSKGAFDAAEQNVNVFASAGLRIFPEVSLISTWTGSQLNMGTSLAPFRDFPLVINLGAGDVTGVYPQGTRFIMSLGYAFRF
ncbi:MAG: hypothetical protein VKJ02_18795 [Snowella sp.]|nr:hypothetical protein [Snowella sp.]